MDTRKVSEQLVRLVQIIFGFVLAQSLGRYDDVVTRPYVYEHRLAALALLSVYFTTVMSWVDWHPTMEANPYNMSSKNPHRRTEVLRLWFDLGVVTTYAYLLFSIEDFAGDPHGDVGAHLVGYPLIFLMYLLSGLSRRRAYGRYASSLGTIATFGFLLAVLAVVHSTVDWASVDIAFVRDERLWGNIVGVSSAFALMVAFRYTRNKKRTERNNKKLGGLKIGFDVDGVLGNQIKGVLPRIERRHGVRLSYDDITDWRLPIGNSSIDVEIVAAMDDPEYIVRMPAHPGAKQVLETLYGSNQILVLTARSGATLQATEQWLLNNALPYDNIFNVKEQTKSLLATDVLIDDYVGNVKEYLGNTNGLAVLVDQPWNRRERAEDEELRRWMEQGRLRVVDDLESVVAIIEEAKRAAAGHPLGARPAPPRHPGG